MLQRPSRASIVGVRAQATSARSAAPPGSTSPPSSSPGKQASPVRILEAGQSSTLPAPIGAPSWPFFGNTFEVMDKGVFKFALERLLKFGPVSKAALFGMDLVMVTSPVMFKAIMAEDTRAVNFGIGGTFQKLQGQTQMDILENKDGKRMINRKTMLAAVTTEAIAGYVPKMVSIAEAEVANLASLPSWSISLEARKWGMKYANALLAGMRTKGAEDEAQLCDDLALFFDGLVAFDIDLPGTPLRKALEAKARLLARLSSSIDAQLDELLAETPTEPGVKVRKNMLGYVVDGQRSEGVTPTNDFLVGMALGLLQAGTDTSAAAFAGTFAVLAQRPDLMERMREEQRSIIKEHGTTITKAALDNSRLLDACVREGIRLCPPGNMIFRIALKDIEVGGKLIKKGQQVMFPVPVLQGLEIEPDWVARATSAVAAGQPMPLPHGTNVKDIAADFVPERWMEADPSKRPSLMTFSHGPHVCLGIALYLNEAKVLLAHMLRRYDIELLTKEIPWMDMPVIKPSNDVQMRLVPIKEPLC